MLSNFDDSEILNNLENRKRSREDIDDNDQDSAIYGSLENLCSNNGDNELNEKDSHWNKMFDLFLTYIEVYGNSQVPSSYTDNIIDSSNPSRYIKVKLGLWLSSQKRLYHNKALSSKRMEKFQELIRQQKFCWGEKKSLKDDLKWDVNYSLLCKYAEIHGHCNILERATITTEMVHQAGAGYPDEYEEAGEEEEEEDQGAENNPRDGYNKHGNDSGDSYTKHDPPSSSTNNQRPIGPSDSRSYNVNIFRVGRWLDSQRQYKRAGTLRPDREQRLQVLVDAGKLKWTFADEKEKMWAIYFDCLRAYCYQHGDAHSLPFVYETQVYVDHNYTVIEENAARGMNIRPTTLRLGCWVAHQRHKRKEGKLVEYRAKLLDELVEQGKFKWSETASVKTKLDRWDMAYEALCNYGQDNPTPGSCNIPRSYTAVLSDGSSLKLGCWLHAQRQFYKQNKLKADRLAKLQALVDEGKLTWMHHVKKTGKEFENPMLMHEEGLESLGVHGSDEYYDAINYSILQQQGSEACSVPNSDIANNGQNMLMYNQAPSSSASSASSAANLTGNSMNSSNGGDNPQHLLGHHMHLNYTMMPDQGAMNGAMPYHVYMQSSRNMNMHHFDGSDMYPANQATVDAQGIDAPNQHFLDTLLERSPTGSESIQQRQQDYRNNPNSEYTNVNYEYPQPTNTV